MTQPPKPPGQPKHWTCMGLISLYAFAFLCIGVGAVIGYYAGCAGIFIAILLGWWIETEARKHDLI